MSMQAGGRVADLLTIRQAMRCRSRLHNATARRLVSSRFRPEVDGRVRTGSPKRLTAALALFGGYHGEFARGETGYRAALGTRYVL